MSPRRYLLLASFLLVVIFSGANLLVQNVFSGVRADFTENRLYTLSCLLYTSPSPRDA